MLRVSSTHWNLSLWLKLSTTMSYSEFIISYEIPICGEQPDGKGNCAEILHFFHPQNVIIESKYRSLWEKVSSVIRQQKSNFCCVAAPLHTSFSRPRHEVNYSNFSPCFFLLPSRVMFAYRLRLSSFAGWHSTAAARTLFPSHGENVYIR